MLCYNILHHLLHEEEEIHILIKIYWNLVWYTVGEGEIENVPNLFDPWFNSLPCFLQYIFVSIMFCLSFSHYTLDIDFDTSTTTSVPRDIPTRVSISKLCSSSYTKYAIFTSHWQARIFANLSISLKTQNGYVHSHDCNIHLSFSSSSSRSTKENTSRSRSTGMSSGTPGLGTEIVPNLSLCAPSFKSGLFFFEAVVVSVWLFVIFLIILETAEERSSKLSLSAFLSSSNAR